MTEQQHALVFGATGNMGGAATRALLERGWRVRAVTRNPQSKSGKALDALGAEVVQADADDRASLERAFEGMTRVFNVQNWQTAGVEGEIRQGTLVADVARDAGVTHLVYGSAGIREDGTGMPHFESKSVVEAHMGSLGLPVTIVRPAPFMELLREKAFFPPLGAWGTMVQIVGWDAPIPWVCVSDIGQAIANALSDPDAWIGQDLELVADVQSMRSAREIFKRITGKKPFRVPLSPRIFSRLAGDELVVMWKWLDQYLSDTGPDRLYALVEESRQLCPTMHSLESWLRTAVNGSDGREAMRGD